MKKGLLCTMLVCAGIASHAQVTLLKANKSLQPGVLLNGKAVMTSDTDSTLWATDGTVANTIQLSSTIKGTSGAALLNGKIYFAATTAATGEELYVTDGTVAGTKLVKDIVPGAAGSSLDDEFAVLNNTIYFIANDGSHGREIWKSDGTAAGTALAVDVVAGAAGSNDPIDDYDLYSNGSYLLFNAKAPSSGVELYKSNGTSAGTAVLKDINPGVAPSRAFGFYAYNNIVLFYANTAAAGAELWKTDGTTGGTTMVKDINPGTDSSLAFSIAGQDGSGIVFFYPFSGKLLFNAVTSNNGDELWVTDGTAAGTKLLKDINPGAGGSGASLFSSIKYGTKLIFTASNKSMSFGSFNFPTNSELWETDGTEAGTKIFKEIVTTVDETGNEGSSPFIMGGYDFTGSNNFGLFQGNKFFFTAHTAEKGNELWICDGTAAGTHMVKDINPNEADGVSNFSYVLTSGGLYFSGDNGIKGSELWKSDGTSTGTTLVADINPNSDPENSDSDLGLGFFIGNKIIFTANNGDDPADDLYLLNGTFTSLPVTLTAFTVKPQAGDAVLQWTTATELNTRDFSIQRSDDGASFTTIGSVAAAGNSTITMHYQFTDAGIASSGRDKVYYRLITNDKDAKTTVSQIVSLKLKGTEEWAVRLLGNPVISQAQLLVTGTPGNIKLTIKDISGKTVSATAAANGNGQLALPVANLVPGTYILVAEKGTERKVIRFIKQ